MRSSAPKLGDDTDAVLSELGFSNQDIAALRGEGGGMNNIWNGPGSASACRRSARDGLQVEEGLRPDRGQGRAGEALSQAGMAKIEVTAFVSPKAIPRAARWRDRVREIERKPA